MRPGGNEVRGYIQIARDREACGCRLVGEHGGHLVQPAAGSALRSASARMLLPRPEIRTTTLEGGGMAVTR